MSRLLKKFQDYDKTKTGKDIEISGLLGIPIGGEKRVEVPNRNGYVYVRLRNSTNELIQAWNEKVSTAYGLPVIVVFRNNRYEITGRDTQRYSDWGSFSPYLPRHGAQHSLNFESAQGGDISFIYGRQIIPGATIPSGTSGAGNVYIEPHLVRNPTDFTWHTIGNVDSPNLLLAKPTNTTAKMLLLYWDLDTDTLGIRTGTSTFAASITGTSAVVPYIPTLSSQNHIPLSAIRLVSGSSSIVWDNIYDARQWLSMGGASSGGISTGTVVVQDEGVTKGSVSQINFVGNNVDVTVSGTVARVFVTGSVGGGSGGGSGSVVVWEDGVLKGSATTLEFTGDVEVSLSGTVARIFFTGTFNGDDFQFRINGALAQEDNVYYLLVTKPVTIDTWYLFCDDPGEIGQTSYDVDLVGVGTVFTSPGDQPTLAYNDSDGYAKSNTPNLVSFVEGDVLAISLTSVATGSVGMVGVGKVSGGGSDLSFPKTALIQDRKSAGTNGGTFTAGADQTRVLNTVVSDPYSIILDLSSNQITLGAGTYEVEIRCPAYRVANHRAWLYNITDATTTLLGSSGFSGDSANNAVHPSIITGRFTITSQKIFEVRHRCTNTTATNGFGVQTNINGFDEIFTSALIRKVS